MFVRVMMWFYYISSPGCTATNLHRLHLPYRRFNNPLLSHVGTLRCHHTCECCFALPIWLSKACYVSFSRMADHLEFPFGVSVLGLASGISMLPLSWTKLSSKKRPKKRPMKVPRLPEAAASRTLMMRSPRGLILTLRIIQAIFYELFLWTIIKTLSSWSSWNIFCTVEFDCRVWRWSLTKG